MNNMKLREVRKSWGLSQREMAFMIGVSLRSYQNWEYSVSKVPVWMPNMITALKLARSEKA